jgi:4-hydroxybenzoate polyprenyltransferase
MTVQPALSSPEATSSALAGVSTAPDADLGLVALPQEGAASRPGSQLVRALLRTLRPHQWVKNLFVLAPMVFHKDVIISTAAGPALNLLVTGRALGATSVYCLLAGAVYTINDLVDVQADRAHPVKRERPIASGALPERYARAAAVALVVVSLMTAYLIAPLLAVVAFIYFAENIAYSFRLKKVAFVDVGLIALGFILRVVAGGIAARVHVSIYMLACTAFIALFLGFGKRRHELAMDNAGKQRASLEAYTAPSLNAALTLTGAATVITYVAYTLDPTTRRFFSSDYLWITIPFTVFGMARFLLLVKGRAGRGLRAESPTQEMLRDVPFVLNLVLWLIVVASIVYKLKPAS